MISNKNGIFDKILEDEEQTVLATQIYAVRKDLPSPKPNNEINMVLLDVFQLNKIRDEL